MPDESAAPVAEPDEKPAPKNGRRKKAATAKPAITADAFDLNDDGTTRLAWHNHDVLLRRPLVGEYLSFAEEAERIGADNAARNGDGPSTAELLGPDSPTLALWARIIRELGAQTVPTAELDPWMLSADALATLIVGWRQSPSHRGKLGLMEQLVAASQNLTPTATNASS